MSKPLLIGSGNRDKAAELQKILEGTPWVLKSLLDFMPVVEPVEDEATFAGNALLKARYYGGFFETACVADDSGIEVDALDGAPGVFSARYAGEDCSYADNNQKMLAALEGIPVEERGARFVCCAAFVDRAGNEHVERGTTEGRIALRPLGTNGFGYDPIFIPEGREQTFGELAPSVKQGISHRGQAFRAMRAYLVSIA